MRALRRWLVAATVAAIAGCGTGVAGLVPPGADPRPWDRPVNGAVATGAWRDDGQPAAPFGPGGPAWSHPEELLEAMAAALGAGDLEARAALASENSNGTVTGWIRVFGPGAPREIAQDLRVDMRADAGSWVVVAVHSRVHCGVALADGGCGS